MDRELALLCQSCGMCCDGSLFGRVDLEPDEIEPARRNRLRVLGGRGFEQPCTALAQREREPGRVCAIYDQRPGACRRFACRLYERHRREGGPLEPRLAAVRRVRELVVALESQGLEPADFASDTPGSARPGAIARETYDELTRRLEEDFARA